MTANNAYEATSASLLIRLKDHHSDADWQRFYDLYAPLIYHFSLKSGCTPAMADDVLQETLLVVAKHIRTFTYDAERGRFRSWLLRIVHSRVIDAFRREKRYVELDDSDHRESCSVSDNLDDKWEQEWQRNLLKRGLIELETAITPYIFHTFRLLEIEHRDAQEVAEMMEISVNTVYQHRHRALTRLKDIIANLANEMGD